MNDLLKIFRRIYNFEPLSALGEKGKTRADLGNRAS